MSDFTTPRRMGAAALLIMFLKNFRKIAGAFFAMIIIIVFKEADTPFFGIAARVAIGLGVLTGLSFLSALLSYYPLKFYVHDDKIIFIRNLFAKRTTSIPTANIHSLRTRRGLIYRLLGVRGIAFDTIATNVEEFELILSEEDWQSFMHDIRSSETLASTRHGSVPPSLPTADKVLKVSNYETIKGALCQNHLHGFAVLAAILIHVLDNINQIDDEASERAVDFVETNFETLVPTATTLLYLFAILYVFVVLLWVGKVLLKSGNMEITETRDRLVLKSGLVSRFTSRIARDKMTILTIKQNPLEKAFKCQTIRILQALNIVGMKDENKITIYGSQLGTKILDWWLETKGTASEDREATATARSGFGVFYRRFVPHLVLALVIAGVMYHFDQTIFATIVCPAYVVFAAVRAVMAWKHSSIELERQFVKVNSGNIAVVQSYIKYGSIETVAVRQTPMTRFTGRVRLSISTNAGSFKVYSLDEAEARAIRSAILDNARRAS